MTTPPSEPSPSTTPRRPTRAVRVRRRVARVVVAATVVVLFVSLVRLGFVDINDHPGLVRTVWIAGAVFVLAFPFVGFRDGTPGDRRDGRPERRE